jgi:hypothetical protein
MPTDPFGGATDILKAMTLQNIQTHSPMYQQQVRGAQMQNQMAQIQLQNERDKRVAMDAFIEGIADADNASPTMRALSVIAPGAALELSMQNEMQKKVYDAAKLGDFNLVAALTGYTPPVLTGESAEAEAFGKTKGELDALKQAGQLPTQQQPQDFSVTKEGTDLTLKLMDRAENFSKDYQTVQNNLLNIEAAVDRLEQMGLPEGAGVPEENRIALSQAIITSFNKITDPTSVVRESEYKRTADGASLFNRLKAKFKKVEAGGELTKADYIEVRETARALGELRREIINKKLGRVRTMAEKRGLNPDEVAPLFERVQADTQQQEQSQQPAQQPVPTLQQPQQSGEAVDKTQDFFNRYNQTRSFGVSGSY